MITWITPNEVRNNVLRFIKWVKTFNEKEDHEFTEPLLQKDANSIYDEIEEYLDNYPYDTNYTNFLTTLTSLTKSQGSTLQFAKQI